MRAKRGGRGASTEDAPEGFTRSKGSILQKRIVAAVQGHEKQGKTRWALTAPGPLAYLNFDFGLEGVVEEFESDKEIFRVDFDMECPPKTDKMAYYGKVWDSFAARFKAALAHDSIRTIIVDTETEAWEAIRLAYFGQKDQIMPHHYGPVNEEWATLFKKIYKTDKNLIFLRKMRAQYVKDKWNGLYEPAGFSKLNYLVQVIGEMVYDEEKREFYFEVKDSRINKALLGMKFRGETCNFPSVASLLFDNEPEDWQ